MKSLVAQLLICLGRIVAQAVYGKSAAETRQSDAVWGSRLVAM